MRYYLIPIIFITFLLALPKSATAQQQAEEGKKVDQEIKRALKVICPKNDDICKLLKELQIKVTRFRKQEAIEDTEGLFATVEGIKYVFTLIERRYKSMEIKPLELTHFLKAKYSFIVVYLHSYLDKYRKKLIDDIELSWKERSGHFANIKKETESANPNQDQIDIHKNNLVKTYQKLIKQNEELKEMYETLVPVYTELAAKEDNVKTNLKELNERIAEQMFLVRKLKQDLERIPK